MNPWDANIRAVQDRYPGLAERLVPEREDDFYGAIRVEAAASGEPTMVIGGIHIHSPRDPVREGRRLAETLREDGALILLGFGLGYAAEAAAGKRPDRPMVVVERRPSVLRKALETRDLRGLLLSAPLIFVLGGEPEGVTGPLRLLETVPRGFPPQLLRNRGLIGIDEPWYSEVERHIHAWISKDAVNAATLRRFGKRWVRNLAANMEAIRDLPGISRLSGVLGDGDAPPPVFLAAAGPSLDETGPFLRAVRERCVVVAVDTSLGYLLKAGADPDFTVVVDPQYWNTRHLDRLAAPKTCLIAESAVYPSVLRHPFERVFLCASLFPLGRFIENRLDPKGTLGAGGSVATTAWDFARTLGAAAVWIAGLDLAFPGFKTHYRGALFEDRALAESGRFVPAETLSVRALRDGHPFKAPAAQGGTVLTDRRLSLYSAWFENRFRQYPAIQNLSLSASSLAIGGLRTGSMAELLALPPRRDEINRTLGAAFSAAADFFRPERREARAADYRAALGKLLEGLKYIRDLAGEAAVLAETGAARKKVSPAERERLLQKLDRAAGAVMDSEVKDVAGFLFPPAAELEAGSPSPDPLNRYLNLSAKTYRSLAEAAEYHLKVLGNKLKTGR
jgi:hypothetical protein